MVPDAHLAPVTDSIPAMAEYFRIAIDLPWWVLRIAGYQLSQSFKDSLQAHGFRPLTLPARVVL
jgi:hypothetical protein